MSAQAGSNHPTKSSSAAPLNNSGVFRVRQVRRVPRQKRVACLALLANALLTIPVVADEPGLTDSEVNRKSAVELAVPLAVDGLPLDLLETSHTPVVVLDGRNVACQAARHDATAAVLRARGRTLIQLYCDQDDCSQLVATSLANALNRQAQRQEELAAANALRIYYTRIAIREQLELLRESTTQVQLAESKQRALLEQGVAPGVDLSSFARQTIQLADQRLQLESQDRQLQAGLQQLTRQTWESDTTHVESLEVRPQSLDCLWLEERATQQRHDLQAWRQLRRVVNQETAEAMAKMLSAVSGGWSIPVPALGMFGQVFCSHSDACLASNLAEEMRLIEVSLADVVRQAVRERCEKVKLGYERVELAAQTLESWRARLEQFEALEERGEVRPDLRAEAQQGWLTARSSEIQRRLEVRLAEIDLAEAIGGLADRCCRGEAWLVSREP